MTYPHEQCPDCDKEAATCDCHAEKVGKTPNLSLWRHPAASNIVVAIEDDDDNWRTVTYTCDCGEQNMETFLVEDDAQASPGHEIQGTEHHAFFMKHSKECR